MHLADLADAKVILALLETVNSESSACGPSYDYPDDEGLVQLKDCTRDVRAHLKAVLSLFTVSLVSKSALHARLSRITCASARSAK